MDSIDKGRCEPRPLPTSRENWHRSGDYINNSCRSIDTMGSIINSVSELFQIRDMFTLQEGTTIDKQASHLVDQVVANSEAMLSPTRVAIMVQETFSSAKKLDCTIDLDDEPLVNEIDLISPLTVGSSASSIGSDKVTLMEKAGITLVFDDNVLPPEPDFRKDEKIDRRQHLTKPPSYRKYFKKKRSGNLNSTLTGKVSTPPRAPPRMPIRAPSARCLEN